MLELLRLSHVRVVPLHHGGLKLIKIWIDIGVILLLLLLLHEEHWVHGVHKIHLLGEHLLLAGVLTRSLDLGVQEALSFVLILKISHVDLPVARQFLDHLIVFIRPDYFVHTFAGLEKYTGELSFYR